MIPIAAFVALIFAYSLVSRRLERTVVTAPMLFTAAGALLALATDGRPDADADRQGMLLVAELGLVMLLFTDASRVAPLLLKDRPNLPGRLLSAGMLLTIALGTLCAMVVFGHLTWWEAGILAAILAPTDAGLGQAVVASPLVPKRIREALNVEAGLNDGLSVPFLMFFLALATTQGEAHGSGMLGRFLVEQLGYGTLIGLGIGLAGGWLLDAARRREWMAAPLTQLGVVALPLGCALASEATGASMFIAAFVAGLATQYGYPGVGRHSVEFAEDWGQLLNLFVFFLFGGFVARAWPGFDLAVVLYAVLSLTLVRMLPVALALAGTGLARPTVLFVGWFGPRGLASIVLGLVYLEQSASLPGEATLRAAVMATVLISIVAHGLTATPGLRRYAEAVGRLDANAPERRSADDDVIARP